MSSSNHTEHFAVNSSLNPTCRPFVGSTGYGNLFKALFCCIVMLFSLFGNSAVIGIVVRNKRMWSTTNFLIANMAASDFLMSFFAMPREITEIFVGGQRWLIGGLTGSALCKTVYFFQDISVAVSIQCLVIISIDRYRGVVYPFRPAFITSKALRLIIPAIWIVAMGLHGTYFYTVRVLTVDNKAYCTFTWSPRFDNRSTQELYYAIVSVVLVMLPLCVILTLYTLVAIEIKQKMTQNHTSVLRRRRNREDARVMRKIIAIVLVFICCITPITIVGILFYFFWDWQMPCGMENLMIATKYVFYSNAALNPCLYFLLNKRYRKGLTRLMNFQRCLKQRECDDIALNALS